MVGGRLFAAACAARSIFPVIPCYSLFGVDSIDKGAPKPL
jgi:hypothetical protein